MGKQDGFKEPRCNAVAKQQREPPEEPPRCPTTERCLLSGHRRHPGRLLIPRAGGTRAPIRAGGRPRERTAVRGCPGAVQVPRVTPRSHSSAAFQASGDRRCARLRREIFPPPSALLQHRTTTPALLWHRSNLGWQRAASSEQLPAPRRISLSREPGPRGTADTGAPRPPPALVRAARPPRGPAARPTHRCPAGRSAGGGRC